VTEEAPGKGADVIVLDVGVWLFQRLLLGCSKKSKKKNICTEYYYLVGPTPCNERTGIGTVICL